MSGARQDKPISLPLTLDLRSSGDVARARTALSRVARAWPMPVLEVTRLVAAFSEIARNAVLHGGGGRARFAKTMWGGKPALEVTVTDTGPGIPDLEAAFQDGWTTGDGMGLGLPGARRLVKQLSVETTPGKGTRVQMIQWT